MTVKLKVVPGEGAGYLEAYTLPDELNAGESIAGNVLFANNGEVDLMALVIITEWDGKAYGAVFNLSAGEKAIITVDPGLITMPNQDAVMTMYACHEELGGEIRFDSKEFKIDHTLTH